MLRSVRSLGLATIALGVAGCLEPAYVDYPRSDGGLPPGVYDTDNDGLCDDTERARNLDANDPDSDGDGFPDGFEVGVGYDPKSAVSPAANEFVVLLESANSSVSTTASFRVDLDGLDISAGIQSEDLELVDDSLSEYVTAVAAISAYPASNVAVIEADAGRFRQVQGQTTLSIEARFRMPQASIESCTRLLPFRLIVKSNDGAIRGQERRALVISPTLGAYLDPATWCATPGVCY